MGDQTACRGVGTRLSVEGWVGDQTVCRGLGGGPDCL